MAMPHFFTDFFCGMQNGCRIWPCLAPKYGYLHGGFFGF